MKITLADNQLSVVRQLAGWTGRLHTFPLADYLLFEAGGALKVTASNLTTTIEAEIEADVEEEGAAMVLPRLFDGLPAQEQLHLSATEKRINLHTPSTKSWVKRDHEPEDFPEPAEGKRRVPLGTILGASFRDALAQVKAIPDRDPNRAYAGREWESNVWLLPEPDGGLQVAACNGFHFALRRVHVLNKAPSENGEAVLVSPQLTRLAGLLSENDAIELAACSNLLHVKGAGINARVARVNGKPPDYEALLPTEEGATRAEIPVGTLRKAVAAIKGFSNACRFTVEEGRLVLAARGDEGAGRVEMEAETSGPGAKICLSADFVRQVLGGARDSAKLVLFVRGYQQPALFRFETGTVSVGDEHEYRLIDGYNIVMPLVLEDWPEERGNDG
jgi:DNA polymerase III sliding clamp (beta) subunit (PCNA family)